MHACIRRTVNVHACNNNMHACPHRSQSDRQGHAITHHMPTCQHMSPHTRTSCMPALAVFFQSIIRRNMIINHKAKYDSLSAACLAACLSACLSVCLSLSLSLSLSLCLSFAESHASPGFQTNEACPTITD